MKTPYAKKILKLCVSISVLVATNAAATAQQVELLPEKALPNDESQLPGEGALPRYDAYLKRWHEARSGWARQIDKDQGAVAFLGDSITQGWGEDFKGKFPELKLANRGIGGDTTRGMLIRLNEDVLSLNPAAFVLLMGTNDIGVGIDAPAIARNFGKIIAQIKQHQPKTPIIWCRIFPSSASKDRPSEKIKQVNALMDDLVRMDKQITVCDTWTLFADKSGDARPEFFSDMLHLNAAGYDRWAGGLRPILATLGLIETQSDSFELEQGFISLFNGRDLTGWGFRPTPPRTPPKNPKPDAPVFVEIKEAQQFDGKTASSDGRYQVIGSRLVVTTPTEGRRIQQLWSTEDFSGDFILRLQFRATPNADSGIFIREPQLQCRDYLLAGPYNQLTKFKEGGWNDLEVTVREGVAVATCNGELLTDSMKVPSTGPIGLEGDRGQIEYRRIRLKKL